MGDIFNAMIILRNSGCRCLLQYIVVPTNGHRSARLHLFTYSVKQR